MAILIVLVVRDILHPGYDLVRASGDDDPAGGVLDGAEDRRTLVSPVRGQPSPPP